MYDGPLAFAESPFSSRWWRSLGGECCPLSLTPLEELPHEPFGLVSTADGDLEIPGLWGFEAQDALKNQLPIHWFDGAFLASFLVSGDQFIDPINRRPLRRSECASLDAYLAANNLPEVHVREIWDLANSAGTETGSRDELMRNADRVAKLKHDASLVLSSLPSLSEVRKGQRQPPSGPPPGPPGPPPPCPPPPRPAPGVETNAIVKGTKLDWLRTGLEVDARLNNEWHRATVLQFEDDFVEVMWAGEAPVSAIEDSTSVLPNSIDAVRPAKISPPLGAAVVGTPCRAATGSVAGNGFPDPCAPLWPPSCSPLVGFVGAPFGEPGGCADAEDPIFAPSTSLRGKAISCCPVACGAAERVDGDGPSFGCKPTISPEPIASISSTSNGAATDDGEELSPSGVVSPARLPPPPASAPPKPPAKAAAQSVEACASERTASEATSTSKPTIVGRAWMSSSEPGSLRVGKVKSYNRNVGFGFLVCDQLDKDVWFSKADLPPQNQVTLKIGDVVFFYLFIGEHDGNYQARRVSVQQDTPKVKYEDPRKLEGGPPRLQGRILRYNPLHGFGFISCSEVESDVWFPKEELLMEHQVFLPRDALVSFELHLSSTNQTRARQVRLMDPIGAPAPSGSLVSTSSASAAALVVPYRTNTSPVLAPSPPAMVSGVTPVAPYRQSSPPPRSSQKIQAEGRVKSYSAVGHYGFISSNTVHGDVWFSREELPELFRQTLRVGTPVRFLLDASTKGKPRGRCVKPLVAAPDGNDGIKVGRVKSYNQVKGYGFIACPMVKGDVWFASGELRPEERDHLTVGTGVDFQLEHAADGKPRAHCVRLS